MSDQPSLAQKFKIPSPKDIKHEQTILIVEDQQDMRLIVTHHLNKLGFKNIHQSQNGYEALEFIGETDKKISLVICDTEMPVLDGYQLLSELRDNPEYRRPPFAITMDNPSKEKIMYALEQGVDEILVKPYTLNDIFPKIQNAFRKFHNPRNPEVVYEFAKTLYRQDKLDEAEKVYKVIADDTKGAARPWVGLARIEMKRKAYDKALTHLNEAEKRNPNFVHLFSTRGQVQAIQNQIEDAINSFKKAIELSPLNPARYEEAAKPLFEQKRYEEGVGLLTQALNRELNFPSLHHYLSEGHFYLKDYKKAIKHIRTALAGEPENVTYLNQLGISLKESGDAEEAMKTYNSIIKLDQDNQAAYYNKAILQHANGNIDDAIKTLNRVVTKFPDFNAAKNKLEEYEKENNAA